MGRRGVAEAKAVESKDTTVTDDDDQYYDDNHEDNNNDDDEVDKDACKIFVSRIPAQFTEASVRRLLEEKLGPESVVDVALPEVVAKEEEDGNTVHDDKMQQQQQVEKSTKDLDNQKQPHRGFGFVTLATPGLYSKALELAKVRGGAKSTSTKKHTLYLRPLSRTNKNQETTEAAETTTTSTNNSTANGICFLWTNYSCPYGKECKFWHEGPGGTLPTATESADPASSTNPDDCKTNKKKKKKCWNYKKGKCALGANCPFSHDFVVVIDNSNNKKPDADESKPSKEEKDCINWKTHGECRRLARNKCPYRHDPAVQQAALAKKQKRKRQGSEGDADAKNTGSSKHPQPLSIKVSGLSYQTDSSEVQSLFGECGGIQQLLFPTFEDSGRSKGFCGILFKSTKAVQQALERLDGYELHGRVLHVTPVAGKWYRSMNEMVNKHQEQQQDVDDDDAAESHHVEVVPQSKHLPEVGEFGQKVKRRKRHGYKE